MERSVTRLPFLQNIEELNHTSRDLDREIELESHEDAFRNHVSQSYMGSGTGTTGFHKSGGMYRRFGSYQGTSPINQS